MKVLLTGGTGYVGRHILQRFVAGGARVRMLVRSRNAHSLAAAEVVTGDLADPEMTLDDAASDVDLIIHCAAHLGPGTREHYRLVNIEATRRLLKAAARTRVARFLYVSSVAVYGWKGPGNVIGPQEGYDLWPELRDDYAWSKIAADRWVSMYRDHGILETVNIRPGIVYGGGRDFVARVWRRLRGRICVIGGRPSDVLPLVHVQDTAEAIWRAACLAQGASPRTVNIVGPNAPTQAEFLELRTRHLGERYRPVWIPLRWLKPWTRVLVARTRGKIADYGSLIYSLAWSSQAVHYDLDATRRDLGWAPGLGPAETLDEIRAGLSHS